MYLIVGSVLVLPLLASAFTYPQRYNGYCIDSSGNTVFKSETVTVAPYPPCEVPHSNPSGHFPPGKNK